jgi:hypothetical protein
VRTGEKKVISDPAGSQIDATDHFGEELAVKIRQQDADCVVVWRIGPLRLSTRETVATETPAFAATSRIVTPRDGLGFRWRVERGVLCRVAIAM